MGWVGLDDKAVVCSAPVLAQYMFDWSVREVGVLMAVLGIVVLPVNALVGRLSMAYEDRYNDTCPLCCCLFSVCCLSGAHRVQGGTINTRHTRQKKKSNNNNNTMPPSPR